MATNVDKFVEPSEIPGSVAVPVGGVIMWMNTAAASMNPTPPAGFEFCDGTAVVTVGSPLLGEIKPNLMITSAGGAKGVARGADVNTAPYGVGTPLVQGGNDLHNHTANSVSNHNHGMKNHSHSMQNHTHASGGGGNHTHSTSDAVQPTGGGATYQGGIFAHFHTISSSGSHTHFGSGTPSSASTGSPNDNTSDGAGSHGHSINNNTVFPVFHTEIAFIVRVL